MPLKLIHAPTFEPLTIQEVKGQLHVDGSAEDLRLESLIRTARDQAQHLTGRQLATATYDYVLDSFPVCAQKLELPLPPLQSVEYVKYYDWQNTLQTLSADDYLVDQLASPGYLVPPIGCTWPKTWIRPDAVTVRMVCGYAEESGCPTTPEGIRQWMLLYIAALFAFREPLGSQNNVTLPRDYVQGLLDLSLVGRYP